MGIVPAGSGNDTWRMSSARTVEQTLQDVARFLTGGIEAKPVDLLELKFANQDSQTKLAIGAVSWGFEGLVNGRANKLPRSLGALRYLVGLVLSLPKLQPHQTAVHSEEFDFRGQIYAASVANIRSLGGGITLFPQADYTDGLADISLVSGNRLLKVLPYVGHILSGRKHPYRVIARSSQVNVQTTEASYADGELLGHGDFELSVLQHALLLIPGADSR
jgi:diacylglycerol kinase (ATP)